MSTLQNSDVIAISSAAIAILALFATLWQAQVARTHSRLSVRPLVEHNFSRNHGDTLGFTLQNCGLGPAIIHELKLQPEYEAAWLSLAEYREMLLAKFQDKGLLNESNTFTGHAAILPNTEILMLRFSGFKESTGDFDLVLKAFRETTVRVIYRCMYGHEYSYSAILHAA